MESLIEWKKKEEKPFVNEDKKASKRVVPQFSRRNTLPLVLH